MTRVLFLLPVVCALFIVCAHPEKQSARYDSAACPLCVQITDDGTCSYCMGTKQCTFCKGAKERTTMSPNILEDADMKPFSYKEPCPFCNSTGTCTYCKGSGKCWSCKGSRTLSDSWQCLRDRQ